MSSINNAENVKVDQMDASTIVPTCQSSGAVPRLSAAIIDMVEPSVDRSLLARKQIKKLSAINPVNRKERLFIPSNTVDRFSGNNLSGGWMSP